MINGLSLFTGIGGLDVALSEWVRPVAYCEIEPYCQAVLLSRMADESLPNAPIWNDITTFDGLPFNGSIDIIYGGFPCQDISIAGLGKGLEGKRSGLFFEIMRLAEEIKPKFIFLENVPAITSRGGLQVVRTIAEMGYDCRWCVISAASVGALHRRERWFLLANFERERLEGGEDSGQSSFSESEHSSSHVADTEFVRLLQCEREKRSRHQERIFKGCCVESVEYWRALVSEMGKCSYGISNRMDRLKSLGNAVVPCQAREAFKILMGLN